MKILDLTNNSRKENTSYLEYKISKFPDGQQSINLGNRGDIKEDVTIKSRLRNFRDLEVILCATAALKNLNTPNIHLYVPYFIGARSDRKFETGGLNYLKEVISPIINSQGYKSVTVLDPHSDVLEATINNFNKIDNVPFVKWSLANIENVKGDLVLVSPDSGALKKVYNVAENLKIENIIIANKHRDIKTGQITHTEVPGLDNEPGERKYVIIDDICDGGRTFIEIAKVILEKRPRHIFDTKIYLLVTHGIFSKGLKPLNNYFDGIFTTNSYFDVEDDNFSLMNDKQRHKLQQLNIF